MIGAKSSFCLIIHLNKQFYNIYLYKPEEEKDLYSLWVTSRETHFCLSGTVWKPVDILDGCRVCHLGGVWLYKSLNFPETVSSKILTRLVHMLKIFKIVKHLWEWSVTIVYSPCYVVF